MPTLLSAAYLKKPNRVHTLERFLGGLPTIVEPGFWDIESYASLQARGAKLEVDVTQLQWLPRVVKEWLFPWLTSNAQLVEGDEPETIADILR